MKRFELQITDELIQVMDAVLDGSPRNPAIEDWLRQVKEISQAAKRMGITWKQRRKPGRPAG